MRPHRPAPITAAAVLLLVFGGEAVVGAAVSVGLAWWWVTPADTRPFLSFLGLAVFVAFLAVRFVRYGVKLLLGALDSPDQPNDFLRQLILPSVLVSLLATFVVVTLFVIDSPTRPVQKELAVASGAVTGWANLAALLVARRLLHRHWSRYYEWRAALATPPTEAEYEE